MCSRADRSTSTFASGFGDTGSCEKPACPRIQASSRRYIALSPAATAIASSNAPSTVSFWPSVQAAAAAASPSAWRAPDSARSSRSALSGVWPNPALWWAAAAPARPDGGLVLPLRPGRAAPAPRASLTAASPPAPACVIGNPRKPRALAGRHPGLVRASPGGSGPRRSRARRPPRDRRRRPVPRHVAPPRLVLPPPRTPRAPRTRRRCFADPPRFAPR